ncbi:unnamed protein product [Didymodactylos carnosus]|uniref:Organic cation transporter n=1 Tax=Didymodactylos carnosus TaxID=1234261 RepID=A0A814WX05_9BILA|nr:unnamed protein product [Didymodactylos carnosus]CAF1324563.1 unnamed protein product [Didymodactylos carnosus]CAF3970864.1 unnamed protein product [Didymodactylos carnosus]CAF4135225.1 unnamed protein product [Didymodactylos carnosus]
MKLKKDEFKRSRGRSIVELLQGQRKSISASTSLKPSTVDQLLDECGSFGLYQIGQFFLVGLLAVLPAMVAFNYVFIAATPEHRCKTHPNDTEYRTIKSRNPCSIDSPTNKTIKCPYGWVYSPEHYESTIVTDWTLVCDRLHLKGLTQNFYILGTGCSILSGIMSDKLGRRTTMYLLIILMTFTLNITQIMMHSTTMTPNMKLLIFTISRFLTGFSQTTYSITLVLLMEITTANKRILPGYILSYFFALGELLVMLIYYYFRSWLLTQWILTIYVMPFLSYYWLIPESPRWLISTRQLPQARRVILRIARVNGRTIENVEKKFYDDLQKESYKQTKKYSYTHVLFGLIKSPVMRERCLILFYIWSVNLMTYLGVGMSITSLHPTRPYHIFTIAAFAEFIGLCLCHFCAHSQALCWIYTGESYPTVIRSTGVGLTVSIARVGGVWAPQISLLSQSIWPPLPYLIFSVFLFVAALLALRLPETKTETKSLPDTVKEAEKYQQQLSTIIEEEPTTPTEKPTMSPLIVQDENESSEIDQNDELLKST